MELKDWEILFGALATCAGVLRYFIRAEFNTLKEALDKRYLLRELADEREIRAHERLQKLEATKWG